ncbi:transmembrane protein 205 [Cucumis melo var. makuwa]|uniref:Transmembrane protein 205 n=1 Tax=Cucumis melo var. makuwa TaxID=1194695 RepID=A0A5D3D3X0_CUCMM|nr:transmembrane protein 205 [Cucumis melo var. makuwa]TYK18219.1 transmembrane protein 205 [Cucumis melo var. makuwa]
MPPSQTPTAVLHMLDSLALLSVHPNFTCFELFISQYITIKQFNSISSVLSILVLQLMKQRHKVERESNIGEEVGWSKNVEVAKVNPKLAAMNKKFGMIHGLSSLANILAFGSLAMHSWYLAGKLNL